MKSVGTILWILCLAFGFTACVGAPNFPADSAITHEDPNLSVVRAPSHDAPPALGPQRLALTLTKADAATQCMTQAGDKSLQLQTCSGNAKQFWSLRAGLAVNQNACLDANVANPAAGTALSFSPCNPVSTTQHWSYLAGLLHLLGTDLCVALPSGAPGAAGTLQNCASGADAGDQTTTLNHADPNNPGGFSIAYAGQPNKCLSLQNSRDVDGAPVQLADCDGSAPQQWSMSMLNLLTAGGHCAEVPAFDANPTANGTQLNVGACDNAAGAKWAFKEGAIILDGTAKCADLTDGNTGNGAKIGINDCADGAPHQQWALGL